MSTFVRAVIHFIRRLSGKFILFGKSITKFVFGPDAHKIALALSVVLVVVYFIFMPKHLFLDLLELSLRKVKPTTTMAGGAPKREDR